MVVMSESVSEASSGTQGGSGVSCAVEWLGESGLAVMWIGGCWAVHKQAQSSRMVWHWNAGGAGVWIVQCWCKACRSCFLSSVSIVGETF